MISRKLNFRLASQLVLYVGLTLLLFSCKGEKNEEKNEVKKADSASANAGTPELKAINEELLKDAGNASLYAKRAAIYIKLKDFDFALNDALRATKLDSSKAEYYITLADVYFASNKTRYAKETLEFITKQWPDNTEGLLKLAELLYLVRQYDPAMTYINSALKIDESLAKAYFLKGNIYKETGDTAKAISSMETAVEQDNQYFQAYNELGLLYSAKRNPIAFQYFDNALRVKPNNQDVIYNKAKLLQDMKKIDESIAMYNQLLQINRDHAEALYNLGAIQLAVKKNPTKAIDYFSKAINADPKYTEAYFARGVSFEELKDFASAKADYKVAMEITPNYDPAIDALNRLERK